mmetsp:Transcript_5306/g.8207  ORF Transcript_5306/g.8207 Transcript_5306/m.8207 type:complete len:82 (-) Transcript_5306:373-618(-)
MGSLADVVIEDYDFSSSSTSGICSMSNPCYTSSCKVCQKLLFVEQSYNSDCYVVDCGRSYASPKKEHEKLPSSLRKRNSSR